jgi:hypothetical protein
MFQTEFGMWCKKNAAVFQSVAADASELIQCKSTLFLASGGNPLLLEYFRRDFESSVLTRLPCECIALICLQVPFKFVFGLPATIHFCICSPHPPDGRFLPRMPRHVV